MKKLLGLLAVAPMALAACGGSEATAAPKKDAYIVIEDDATVTGHYLGHGKYGQEATVADGGDYNAIIATAVYDVDAAGTADEIIVNLYETTGYVNVNDMGYTLEASDIWLEEGNASTGRYINSLFNVTDATDHFEMGMNIKTDDNYGSGSFNFITGVSDPANAGFAAATCADIKAWVFDTTKKDGTGLGTSGISSATNVNSSGAAEFSLYLAAMQDVANKACTDFAAA